MNRFKVELQAQTDPAWTQVILENFNEFLRDHADCERKASAMAMHFVAKCWDRTRIIPLMIELALEELTHFRQVYELMEKRGVQLIGHVEEDPYVNGLLDLCRSGRNDRFLDRLLVASIIETRGTERFNLVAQALEEPELKAFYKRLCASEAKHGDLFLRCALMYFDEAVVQKRVNELVREEARIMTSLKWRPSLH